MPTVGGYQGTALFAGVIAEPGARTETRTSEEASAEIPFGVMVCEGTDQEEQALLSAAQADLPVGIVVHRHAYQKPHQLGTTGLKPGVTFEVLHRGVIWVTAVDAVTPDDAVKYNEAGGTFQTAASAGVTVDISAFARWRGSAGAGELVKLEIDMTNRAQRTLDT